MNMTLGTCKDVSDMLVMSGLERSDFSTWLAYVLWQGIHMMGLLGQWYHRNHLVVMFHFFFVLLFCLLSSMFFLL